LNLLHILQPPAHLTAIPWHLAKRFSSWPDESFHARSEPGNTLVSELTAYLPSAGWKNVKEIAAALGRKEESVRRALYKIRTKGKLAKLGTRATGYRYLWVGDLENTEQEGSKTC